MAQFGANFRKAREAQGITLHDIAVETRISTRFLQAIESEEFHLLPGGIFNRGFIRSYAERIGLDADQAVADYERLSGFREQPPDAPVAPDRPSPKAQQRLYLIAIGGLILLFLIVYFVTRSNEKFVTSRELPEAGEPASNPATPALPEPEITAPEVEESIEAPIANERTLHIRG